MKIAHLGKENDLGSLLKELLPMVKRVCEHGRESLDIYGRTKEMNPLYLDCIRALHKIEQIESLLNKSDESAG